MRETQFGPGFSKEVEAILGVVQMGAQMGTIYIYPHEVRESLRRAGMPLDENLQKLTPFPTYEAPEFPEGYEPDFGDDEGDDLSPGLNDDEEDHDA